ncbi:hypothetical protein BDA99DRAFT_532102 [Phascolomyces articulosus]|uniref:Uncharacterized protein n=1 Tax=Phascolomyces articulosus TaxID=60185 RepID=A0AAD5KAZ6_9FUNG|nr:hypothetical protein BDA99DRAFT_532102 [Phascolomyces articulosus]
MAIIAVTMIGNSYSQGTACESKADCPIGQICDPLDSVCILEQPPSYIKVTPRQSYRHCCVLPLIYNSNTYSMDSLSCKNYWIERYIKLFFTLVPPFMMNNAYPSRITAIAGTRIVRINRKVQSLSSFPLGLFQINVSVLLLGDWFSLPAIDQDSSLLPILCSCRPFPFSLWLIILSDQLQIIGLPTV